MWSFKDAYLINEQGKVMDVYQGKDKEQQNIIVWKKHNGLNQQWDLIYADKFPREPVKGELNKEFGMYVQRDFYIVSQLKANRYLDLVGRNFVIKTPNGRNSQTWYFDQRSLTIKTRWNNQSWDIRNSGRTNNMQVWSTNSGWW
jgi:hypothetical protein